MGDDRPRGEAAIRRGPVGALGLGRRHVTLSTDLPPEACVARLEARTIAGGWLGWLGPNSGRALRWRRGDRLVLLRGSRYVSSFRPAVCRFAEGSVALTLGPPKWAAALAVYLLVIGTAMFVSVPWELADGNWSALAGLVFPPMWWHSFVTGRDDAEWLREFVAETLDAR